MNELHDFWYSAKFEANLQTFRSHMPKTKCYVRGERYSECCPVGLQPLSAHFGDLVYVGTGTTDEIEVRAA